MIFENMDRIVFTGDSVTDAGCAKPVGEGLFDNLGHGYVREIENLLVGLDNLLGSSTKINNIEVSSITINKIKLAKNEIANSHILNATITKQIDGQTENLVVPKETYELYTNFSGTPAKISPSMLAYNLLAT